MSRIAICAHSPVPFRLGGAERLYDGLRDALIAAGHSVEVVKLPVREHTLPDLIDGYAQFARLDLSHFDIVISGRYPAWMVDHPHHVLWMLHPLRGLYDTYPHGAFVDWRLPDLVTARRLMDLLDEGPTTVEPTELFDAVRHYADDVGSADESLRIPSPLARSVVHHLDRAALDARRIRRHAAISATVAGRPDYFPPDVEVTVVHPPAALGPARIGEYGDLFVAPSRLERAKRLDLVIDGFRRSDAARRLLIVGDGSDAERLRELADGDDRIGFAGRVPDAELSELYATARAVIFCPRDEDYGYVSVEAATHARPVITTTDSGGVAELVDDGRNGLVVEPSANALAGAIDRLATNPELAGALGRAAAERTSGQTWDHVVEALIGSRRRRTRTDPRPRIVAVSTYPVHPRQSGGQIRAFQLLRHLAADGDVTAQIVSVSTEGAATETYELSGGVTERSVPLSERHTAAETELRLVSGPVSITDVAVSVMWRATPALVRELRNALDDAAAVIFVHPYLAPAVVDLAPDLPMIADEHNHERALKHGIYPANEGGRWLLGKVVDAERTAVQSAALVTATTDADLSAIIGDYATERGGDVAGRGAVIPNGVDTASIPFVTGVERVAAKAALTTALGLPAASTIALFVGSGHGPNIEAGRAIVDVASRMRQVQFLLVGRHATYLARPTLPSNVHLLGPVSDRRLNELLTGADVALNPMLSGGGSNLKLVTYLAAGLPVVTSAVGARGLDVSESGVIIGETASLGAAIETLRAEREDRATLGRRYVEAHADWSAIGAEFRKLVTERVLS